MLEQSLSTRSIHLPSKPAWPMPRPKPVRWRSSSGLAPPPISTFISIAWCSMASIALPAGSRSSKPCRPNLWATAGLTHADHHPAAKDVYASRRTHGRRHRDSISDRPQWRSRPGPVTRGGLHLPHRAGPSGRTKSADVERPRVAPGQSGGAAIKGLCQYPRV